ncbi:2-C-methyl-D-erythritol 4-phosphate cytidylyltransferase [Neoehrlichia mikurensis]|uniref:2-C-methyl-D-erythritol 4-phosphate cytidylyltransferase n=1 Tax=Neoehrlichia mikurensis TaxID=89586 RepID=A0A9Q9BTK1_9RICK|nr:IspD/TarI family cytidylyltransferase [Neoehrlichia mikurensis]QXK92245.1 2-C-methyl-D-erythritol 4-phosphate cytidylyltransferase [Neoehrlichia mikurensis]QXK92700.1 2-C-methyl-D-erythritol 4-phosphate cytidylyltransferase [Neoehrlichia mikurensis]QXK93938.1 2-C-methyl-D-erythritol 4-phosphate cytidylyltransferase [Neoehrlichia mikurensis]UTO55900.1 2-C-methyl-D-erythritol 4-phosphate cytidylyltransferase [Neoehrlichia mikurensis]UTO56816.1 2-C-methyl-D-erythritol 4-phosphate cytidylyltran
MTTIAIIIVASGVGSRCKNITLPKQYSLLSNHSVLHHTISSILYHPAINYIQVIIKKDHKYLYDSVVSNIYNKKILPPIYGGNRRQDSVRLGLQGIAHIKPDFVLIHDACRPFITHDLVNNIIKMLDQYEGAVPVLSINETIKIVHNNIIINSINRDSVKIIQTPQAYQYQNILTCHERIYATDPHKEFTDDLSIMLDYNITVATVKGHPDNIKITTFEDLCRARIYVYNNLSIIKKSNI